MSSEHKPSSRDVVPGFGAALKARREAQGLSQIDVQVRSKVGFSYISKLERGLKAPSLRVAAALAKALGVKVDELLEEAAKLASQSPESTGETEGDSEADSED